MFQGSLFTRDWLKEGIAETPEWQALDSTRVGQLWEQTRALLIDPVARKKPTEAETEEKLIYPLLGLLGWQHKSVQQNMSTKGRKDVPDALLFGDAEADERAKSLDPWQRFRHGAALVEAKRWSCPLDREGQGEQGVPSTQIIHYLRGAAVVADGKKPCSLTSASLRQGRYGSSCRNG